MVSVVGSSGELTHPVNIITASNHKDLTHPNKRLISHSIYHNIRSAYRLKGVAALRLLYKSVRSAPRADVVAIGYELRDQAVQRKSH